MAKPFDLVVVGDICTDLILSGDVTPAFGQVEKLLDDATLVIGGSATIFACGAARLGLRVAFVGKVGDDVFGRFLLDALEVRGIDTSYIVRDPVVKTGQTIILSRGQDRAMLTYLGTIGALRYDEINLEILELARHVHMGSYFLLDNLIPEVPRLFAEAQRRGLTVSLDTNYDPAERWDSGLAAVLQHVDIFLPNETELTRITQTPDLAVRAGQGGTDGADRRGQAGGRRGSGAAGQCVRASACAAGSRGRHYRCRRLV